MPQTREQISELKNIAEIVIKQLFKEPYFIKQITDSVSNEIAKSVKQQLATFEKKVDELKSNIHDVKKEHKKVVKKLNDEIDLLSAKVNDSLLDLVICSTESTCVVENNEDPLVPIDPHHPGLLIQLPNDSVSYKKFPTIIKSSSHDPERSPSVLELDNSQLNTTDVDVFIIFELEGNGNKSG
ncbi:hypothetical protein JTB14_012159 [Gonioctena quinquepunctata]|nr:hypothetical protein JTB14_012159 [Gonioctena quinquepunctata]